MAGESLKNAGKALQGCGCGLGCLGMLAMLAGGLVLAAVLSGL